MTSRSFTELSPAVVGRLRATGFRSLQLSLVNEGSPILATVEVIPHMETDFGLDRVGLYSRELDLYIGTASPMARYIIDRTYLGGTA